LQPYPDRPEALWWLYQLSSVDKHRTIHVVVPFVGGEDGEIRAEPAGFGILVGIWSGEIKRGAPVAFARGADLSKVQVKVRYSLRIVIRESEKLPDLPLSMLGAIKGDVHKAVDAIEESLSTEKG
jgi:hypothetical protein